MHNSCTWLEAPTLNGTAWCVMFSHLIMPAVPSSWNILFLLFLHVMNHYWTIKFQFRIHFLWNPSLSPLDETRCFSSEFPKNLVLPVLPLWYIIILCCNCFFFLSVFSFFFFSFFLAGLQHMEVPGLGFKLELQLPVYTTATSSWDPSCVCDLHCSLWQRWILNPLSDTGDQTCIFTDTMSGS